MRAATLEAGERGDALGVFHATAEDEALDGRIVTVEGRAMINFGSCGYTGLEVHPELTGAVVDAVRRYGTQLSSSRSYLSAPDYPEAEATLSRMFGRPATITGSTSMANMAVATTLTTPDDIMLVDAQAHRSLQTAVLVAQSQGTGMRMVPHNNTAVLRRWLAELSGRHRRVWYCADGLYSMFGDFAPIDELDRIAAEYPNLWLLIDDAHSVSWLGRNGRGSVLDRLSPGTLARTITTGSLNKAFGAAGGVMTFPDEATRQEVFTLSWPTIFSGPLQPPMLAAVLASARLHLTDEITARQAHLLRSIRLFNLAAARHGLPLVTPDETPLRYVAAGGSGPALGLASRLQKAGFLVNPAIYPAVPAQRSGIRIALTVHQTDQDIAALAEAIATLLPQALAEDNATAADLTRGFRREFAGREITLRETVV